MGPGNGLDCPKGTREQARLLTEQAIDAEAPGTRLRDCQTLLGFIGPGGLATAGKHHLLPRRRLAERHARWRRGLDRLADRPQQRSFPNMHGLYLLPRRTGQSMTFLFDYGDDWRFAVTFESVAPPSTRTGIGTKTIRTTGKKTEMTEKELPLLRPVGQRLAVCVAGANGC